MGSAMPYEFPPPVSPSPVPFSASGSQSSSFGVPLPPPPPPPAERDDPPPTPQRPVRPVLRGRLLRPTLSPPGRRGRCGEDGGEIGLESQRAPRGGWACRAGRGGKPRAGVGYAGPPRARLLPGRRPVGARGPWPNRLR